MTIVDRIKAWYYRNRWLLKAMIGDDEEMIELLYEERLREELEKKEQNT